MAAWELDQVGAGLVGQPVRRLVEEVPGAGRVTVELEPTATIGRGTLARASAGVPLDTLSSQSTDQPQGIKPVRLRARPATEDTQPASSQ
jgi:hypothetical protein